MTLAVLVIAGSYLIARGVSRELAVARLQSDFVSAVSHEFRTPLTSLHQFTEILVEDDDLPAAERRSFYEALARATRRLTRLVESLLDFGRMEAGARPYRLEPLDAAPFAAAVAAEFWQEVSAQGFLIECHTPAGAVPVRADKDALAQALWNLLDNAVKYSETAAPCAWKSSATKKSSSVCGTRASGSRHRNRNRSSGSLFAGAPRKPAASRAPESA